MLEKLKAGDELLQEVTERLGKENMEYDAYQKRIFKYRAVLAVILHLATEEFADVPLDEIIRCIDAETISDERNVSEGETVRQGNAESRSINEKTLFFDLVFLVRNPKKGESLRCEFHVDYEVQKSLRISYPVEYRGVYYLARMISSQLNYVFLGTRDYRRLRKVFSIWVCINDIRPGEENSVVRYRFDGQKIAGDEFDIPSADLMELIVIKLGDANGSAGSDREREIVRFLYGIFAYNLHKEYFEKYIDTKAVEDGMEIRKELDGMSGTSIVLIKEVLEQGMEQGMKQGIKQGMEQGKLDMLIEMVRDGELSIEYAAQKANMDVETFREKMNALLQKA